MNKFKIVKPLDGYGGHGDETIYDVLPIEDVSLRGYRVGCRTCLGRVSQSIHYPGETLRYYAFGTSNPNYMSLKHEDFMYTFCSRACLDLFQLNPLAYE